MLLDDQNLSPAAAQLELLKEIRDLQRVLLTKVEKIEHKWEILEERIDSMAYAIKSQNT